MEPKHICAISLSSIENGGEGWGEEELLYLLETTELPYLVPWQRSTGRLIREIKSKRFDPQRFRRRNSARVDSLLSDLKTSPLHGSIDETNTFSSRLCSVGHLRAR
jgi:hypothetical protein